MPYFLIGNILAAGLGILAFIEAGNAGRFVLVVLFGATFLVPKLVPEPTLPYLMLAARSVIGIGCYVFYRWRNS
jgi:hypothetical protein